MGSTEWCDSVPPGFRFHPTDEELVDHYLKGKMEDEDFEDGDIVPEIDVCKQDPKDLPALFTEPYSSYRAMELIFFSPRDLKYTNSTRANRRTPSGYWKPTGEPRVIKARRSKAVIGKKRILTFYEYCQPTAKKTKPTAKKTNWVMHQYDRSECSNPKLVQRDFVLCRVKQKSDKDTSISYEGEHNSYDVPNYEYQTAAPESQYYSSSGLQTPTCIELGVVLQANGINDDCSEMQSPFGDNSHSLTQKNDISTCDEGDPHSFTVSDFQNEAADDMFRSQLHVTQQAATSNECLKWHPPHGDDRAYVTYRNNTSTYDDNESISYTASDTENQAAYDRTSELYPQPEDLGLLFHTPQVQDYTLLPLVNANVGDVLHDNNYIACNESYTFQFGVYDSFPRNS